MVRSWLTLGDDAYARMFNCNYKDTDFGDHSPDVFPRFWYAPLPFPHPQVILAAALMLQLTTLGEAKFAVLPPCVACGASGSLANVDLTVGRPTTRQALQSALLAATCD